MDVCFKRRTQFGSILERSPLEIIWTQNNIRKSRMEKVNI
jgi:hypothetical protein